MNANRNIQYTYPLGGGEGVKDVFVKKHVCVFTGISTFLEEWKGKNAGVHTYTLFYLLDLTWKEKKEKKGGKGEKKWQKERKSNKKTIRERIMTTWYLRGYLYIYFFWKIYSPAVYYRPFLRILPRSSALVNWISVRLYETDCSCIHFFYSNIHTYIYF